MTHQVSVCSLHVQPVLFHVKSFLEDCDDTLSVCAFSTYPTCVQKAMTRVALWPSVKSTKKVPICKPKASPTPHVREL